MIRRSAVCFMVGLGVLLWAAFASSAWSEGYPEQDGEFLFRAFAEQVGNPGAESTAYGGLLELQGKPLPEPGDKPFGSFDTPLGGAWVRGSVPVTGWALDDVGVETVKIYRQSGGSRIYVGDAVSVEGARPDIAEFYPSYPGRYTAGWGYMMLTNFLPNGGNGTFVIEAVATDTDGKQTSLGTKTIRCDNAHAVKPFGAIDTPMQGDTISGTNFVNWGWALTPKPDHIPNDGSTVNVWVDGVKAGHPRYNIMRSDIKTLFPGYANSDGAAGYYYLDTTAYANGIHTIQWSVTDSGGDTDGIGSRYFSVANMGTDSWDASMELADLDVAVFDEIPTDYSVPVQIRTGYDEAAPLVNVSPSPSGVIWWTIRETDRLEVRLNEKGFTGYLLNGVAKPLPVGSHLDRASGVFAWIPGPGFLGPYELAFVRDAGGGKKTKKVIHVWIEAMQRHIMLSIQANESGGYVRVGKGEPVSVGISLDPGDFTGMEVYYFLLARKPDGWESFHSGLWREGIAPLARAGVIPIPSFVEVSSFKSLASDVTFYFIITTPTFDRMWWTTVQVDVD